MVSFFITRKLYGIIQSLFIVWLWYKVNPPIELDSQSLQL